MNTIPIMKEHDFSRFGKGLVLLFFVVPAVGVTIFNILQGNVLHPRAFGIVGIGFVLFATAKMSVIGQGKLTTFGSRPMTDGMSNLYRAGYWLIIVGCLMTFLP